MKRKIFPIVLLAFLCFSISNALSQEVIPASGGEGSGSGGSFSYSVGQVVYTTITSEDGTITQGVQQPFEIFIISSIDEAKGITVICSAFPNPTTGNLTLRVDNYEKTDLFYQLFDFNGRLITSKKVIGGETGIEMTNLSPATYFLRVFDGKQEIKTFKIIKK